MPLSPIRPSGQTPNAVHAETGPAGMPPSGPDADALARAAEIIGARLSGPSDLKSVLKEIDDARRGDKGVERIVAEAENRGRLLRSEERRVGKECRSRGKR